MTALRCSTLTVALASLTFGLTACSPESAPKSPAQQKSEGELRGKAMQEEMAKRAGTPATGTDKMAGSSPTGR